MPFARFSTLTRALLLISITTTVVRGDLSLSLVPSSSSFVEGTSGYVDVFINGDTGDALDAFLAQIEIAGGSGLQFTATQVESHLVNSNYVFNGRSNSVITSNPTTAFPSLPALQTLNVGDVSDDGANAPMTGNSNPFSGWISGSPRLLARLDLEALLGGVGSYTLGIVGLNSSFTDDAFTPFTFNSPSINLNVTAVPEPSSIGGAAALALGGLHFRRKRSKSVRR